MPQSVLFSKTGLALLDRMVFDPCARSSFEIMSGALLWSDELPPFDSGDWDQMGNGNPERFLLAYRASLTLGHERLEFRPVWEQVVRHAPRWPGLHSERRGEKARHRLEAAFRRQDACLKRIDLEEGWSEEAGFDADRPAPGPDER